MGSAISPIIADIIMDDIETEALSLLDFMPAFYFRFVDDIISCIYKDKINHMVHTFNNIIPNIQFTHKIEKDNNINFLDLLLINNDNKIITNWSQKSSFSGPLLNYISNHPRSHKIGIINNLVDRAIKLSDKRFHNKNIKFCKNLLLLNDYPTKFVNKYVEKRIHTIKQIINNNESNININNNQPDS